MLTMQSLTTFLGWCTVINIAVLFIASISMMAMRGTMIKMHSGMFGLGEENILRTYFQYLAQYKIAVFVLNLVPYIALKAMA